MPRFADETFRAWWRRERAASAAAAAGSRHTDENDRDRRVILWVDTFTDHFHPDAARAAVSVLEDAGCSVVVPDRVLCCGRPLYDWGFLGQAKALLRDVLGELRDEIRAGTPIVGLEPSCISVFRDEAPNLLHGHLDAQRLADQARTLTEHLAAIGYRPGRLTGRALVQGHCHHKSVLDFESELRVLRATGLELDVPDSGCCGMAGAFGFERGEHYRVSMAAGERVLLPAVREAAADTFVVAGGFSCREQIEQATGRRVLHPAELLALGLASGGRTGRDASRSDEQAHPEPGVGAPSPSQIGAGRGEARA